FETDDGSSMEDLVLDTIDATVDRMNPKRRRDPDALADSVQRAIRSAVDQVWKKRPIVKVLVSVVERRK
ncbi:MAG: MBL fold metallo-hydrolase, partial [Pseudomonadota bacterium]